MKNGSFDQLIGWQKAMRLAEQVYRTTADFPKTETFGLRSQLRRCAVSVPSNIAEGHGRITRGEWRQFLGQARGSILELHTQLLLAKRLGFGDCNCLDANILLAKEVGRILNGLLKSTANRPLHKPDY